MSCQSRTLHNEKGFALLEAIITLVLVSILGAMFFEFMGPQLTGSPFQVLYPACDLPAPVHTDSAGAPFLADPQGWRVEPSPEICQ